VYLITRNGFKILTHVNNKTTQFEIVVMLTEQEFSKGLITWQISARAEISAWFLEQILRKSNWRLHGE